MTGMEHEKTGHADPLGPLGYRRFVPLKPSAASDRLGWVALQAARYSNVLDVEIDQPSLTHHTLGLCRRPPDEMEVRRERTRRHRPLRAGSVGLAPAGSPARVRWKGRFDWSFVFLESGLVTRVAAESFDLDPGRSSLWPIHGLVLPQLTAALRVVDAELTAGDAGGPLVAESLAHVLAVHLIRHVLAPRRIECGRDGTLPRTRLRAVVEFIEGHLDAGVTLEQMAAVARLSPYHFARQFKAATGLPPYRYVIARRVERAKQLLQGDPSSLAQVAARSGFSDQSLLSHHFKRLVGVTPGRFRTSTRVGDRVRSRVD
jgi:AraC family transcriptional regulator